MHVLPDVVPSVTPTVDLEVLFGEGAGIGDHGGSGGSVFPGVFLDPALTRTAPTIQATPFHEDTRKYTLMLVDPDVPDEASNLYTTYIHWLVSNVPLSLRERTVPTGHAPLLPYVPPHPARGSPYHRYTMLLFEQGTKPVVAAAREGIDVSAFAAEHDLSLAGIHFWREKWTDKNRATVSSIYEELQVPEPRYGHLPRPDKLKDEMGIRRSKYYS